MDTTSVTKTPRDCLVTIAAVSTHELSDTERMVRLMGQVAGVRLAYKPLQQGE